MARQARRIGSRVAKRLVIAGIAFQVTMNDQELYAAEAKDAVFGDILSDYRRLVDSSYTVQDRLMHENVIRASFAIAGEEAGGWGLGIVGAAGGGLLGLPSGPGAIVTGAAGGIGGGIVGGIA